MLPSSPGALLTLALLTGTAEAAEPPRAPLCTATTRLDLLAEPTLQAREVCISSDMPTTFVFDSLLPPDTVELPTDARTVSGAQGADFVTVNPKRGFLPGERVKMTVRFADGAAPAAATFWLVGHGGLGARRVEVFRQPRPADALTQEVAEAKAEARQCQEDREQLLAERRAPGGLMGVAWLERAKLVTSEAILGKVVRHPSNALGSEEARSYSHSKSDTHPASIAAKLRLFNPSPEPWTAAGAVLRDATGAEVDLSVWQESAMSTGVFGYVVVGAETPPEQLVCPCTLKLWEAGGPRTVTLGNVTFPVGQKAAP